MTARKSDIMFRIAAYNDSDGGLVSFRLLPKIIKSHFEVLVHLATVFSTALSTRKYVLSVQVNTWFRQTAKTVGKVHKIVGEW